MQLESSKTLTPDHNCSRNTCKTKASTKKKSVRHILGLLHNGMFVRQSRRNGTCGMALTMIGKLGKPRDVAGWGKTRGKNMKFLIITVSCYMKSFTYPFLTLAMLLSLICNKWICLILSFLTITVQEMKYHMCSQLQICSSEKIMGGGFGWRKNVIGW